MATAHKTVLLVSPRRQCGDELVRALGQQPWLRARATEDGWVCGGRGLTLRFDVADTVEQALARLSRSYYNAVVLDCRHLPGCGPGGTREEQAAFAFLEALRREPDRERRYPFRRIIVLIGGADAARSDRLLFAMGERHVGRCLRDGSLSASAGEGASAEAKAGFAEEFWSVCHRLLLERQRGKKTINAAGGGISGLYYELGVLKCLDDALDKDVRDFDLYYGISAGAMVAAGLANGFHVDELIAKLGRLDEAWPYRLQLSWRHLNLGEIPRRLLLAQRELTGYLVRMVRGQDDFSVASMLGAWAVLLGPLFDNAEFEEVIRRLFSTAGHTNDFASLRRRLFIGATDQDRREHVLFGDENHLDVPISKAIQASAAMHPFFPSVEINGRHYTDGIVTRTSNLRHAIDQGADLVFVLDPFVPLISDEPGTNARRSNMWVVEQDYKTLSHTRYEQARNEILRRNSRVSIYTFVPSNSMRRLMSGQNPFVSRNFHPIVCAAYRSAYRRMCHLETKLRGDLASHGMRLDLEPVAEKVQRLESARTPDVEVLLESCGDRRSVA
ncbi:MAG: patatin-like phospholipase family protein [Acidobacteriota bacterium]